MNTTTTDSTNYGKWWRELCDANDRITLSGDLPHDPAEAAALLQKWANHGITTIIDCRLEWSDEDFVREHQPHIDYHHMPIDDAGQAVPTAYFDGIVKAARNAKPGRIMVHCHMGINRGPSAALAILMDQGYLLTEALTAIRQARPIAAMAYAEDAWHAEWKRQGMRSRKFTKGVAALNLWRKVNHLRMETVIHQIRKVEHEDRVAATQTYIQPQGLWDDYPDDWFGGDLVPADQQAAHSLDEIEADFGWGEIEWMGDEAQIA